MSNARFTRQPVAPNTTVKGRAMNRRVEIYLSNNGGSVAVEEVGGSADNCHHRFTR